MGTGHNELVIDLSGFILQGEVLDMGSDSMGVIYRALKQGRAGESGDETAIALCTKDEVDDYNWLYGNPDRLPFEDGNFNNVTAFFAFSKIKNNHARLKALKEAARILKNDGKLYIWDMNLKVYQIAVKKRLKVLLADSQFVSFDITRFSFPGGFDMNTIMPAVNRFFIIQEMQNNGGYFYLRAMKKDNI